MSSFESSDFSASEIKTTINSAYLHTQNFGSKYYEDEDKVNQVRMKLKRGVSKKEIRLQLSESNIEDAVIDSVIHIIEEDESDKRFWNKNEKGVINIIHYPKHNASPNIKKSNPYMRARQLLEKNITSRCQQQVII